MGGEAHCLTISPHLRQDLQLEALSPIISHLTHPSLRPSFPTLHEWILLPPLHWQAVCVLHLAAKKYPRTTSHLLVCAHSGIADSVGRGCVKPSRVLGWHSSQPWLHASYIFDDFVDFGSRPCCRGLSAGRGQSKHAECLKMPEGNHLGKLSTENLLPGVGFAFQESLMSEVDLH